MGVLHGAVLDDQGISLGAVAAEDGSAIKGQVQRLGEAEVRVSKEADLVTVSLSHLLAREEMAYPAGARRVQGLAPCLHA